MRAFSTTLLAISLVLLSSTNSLLAETRGELISSKVIWDRSPVCRDTDIVRFQDRWLVVFCEMSAEYSKDATLRVISSENGDNWESVAQLKHPVPKRSLRYDPAFTVLPDGQLMLAALGMKTTVWKSTDGRSWSAPELFGPKDQDLVFSRFAWNNKLGLNYAYGDSCGNGSGIQLFSTTDGKTIQTLFQKNFEFIPDDASIFFKGDTAYCLMSRQVSDLELLERGFNKGRQFQSALLGSASAPYTQWKWAQVDAPICVPNLIQLPDQKIIGTMELSHKFRSLSMCELHVESGKVSELLEIPTPVENMIQAAYHRQIGGIAHHDGQVWVTYHATENGKLSVHLAKVRLKTEK